jgi:Cu/Ag efflux pump CusA
VVRWLSTSSVRNRRALLAVALVLTATAAWQLRHVKRDVLPEFVPPTVEVQTEALGLSADEMEQLITVPLERNFLN